MICKECGACMCKVDTDYISKGNYDFYWECNICDTGCIEEIRFSHSCNVIWSSENDVKGDK